MNNKCRFCNKPSGIYDTCKECYKLIQSRLEKTYKSSHKTKNGTMVKSKSEYMICNFLTDHGINFEYEKTMLKQQVKHPDELFKPIRPDFYIEKAHFSTQNNILTKLFNKKLIKDVYIEHFGGSKSNNPLDQTKYKEIVNYKIEIYKQKGITLICTYEEDLYDVETSLSYKLTNYQEGKINYFKEH